MKKFMFVFVAVLLGFTIGAQDRPDSYRAWASIIGEKNVIHYDMIRFEKDSLKVKVFHNLNKEGFSIQVFSDNMDQPVSLAVFDRAGNRKENRILKPGVITQFGNDYLPGEYIVKAVQGSRSADLKLIKQ